MPNSGVTYSLDTIEKFLAHKRLAMVGLSRDPKDFSAMLYRELCKRGYVVVPVNPNAAEVQGQRSYGHVGEIEPPVEAVLLMTPAEATEKIVEECAQAGIQWVWMYGPGSAAKISEKAVAYCKEHGMEVIAGECPFMFFQKNGWHRIHGWLQKMAGKYPKRMPSDRVQ